MTLTAEKYATDLVNSGIGNDILKEVSDILDAVPEIRVDFEDPTVALERKHIIIDRVFPEEIRNCLKLLCDNQDFALWDDICKYCKNGPRCGSCRGTDSWDLPPARRTAAAARPPWGR